MLFPFLVTFVGFLCGIQITYFNGLFIYKYRKEKHNQTFDMIQFYYRFYLDLTIGIATCLYLGHLLFFYFSPQVFEPTRPLVLWFGLLTSNFQMARMMFQLFISSDRAVAAFFPIEYRINHSRIRVWPFFFFSMLTGLFQDFIFFYCCDFVIFVPKNCLALGCVMNTCYRRFWSTYQTVILSAIVLLSCCFSIRLFLWSKNKQSLNKANRLAVLDAVVTFFCQFIPPLCVLLWPDFQLFQFSFAGPFNLTGKLIGNFIESILMMRLLKKHSFSQNRGSVTKAVAVRRASHVTHSSDNNRI